ncbi:MAG: DUF362 domain-containing protein [Desulfobacteraceae bacterium]|nr:MAG: DUF362 domain-containing protein [Desulfobacteraceae bacterium]
MSRREFLVKSAQCAACAAAIASIPPIAGANEHAGVTPDLILANGSPGPAVKSAVEAIGGMNRFLKPGARVVIKPNMSFANPPEWATTTHPDVVAELTSMCVKAGASSVLVLDNPLRNIEMCLEKSGIRGACSAFDKAEAYGVKDRGFFQEVAIKEGKALNTTMIMKKVLEADLLIAAPVAKSHSSTGVSLSMKGMMGLVYDRRTFHMDMDLDTAIVDLCTVLKPALTIIDASRILSDSGPGGPGKVVALNKIIASTDFVAADALAVEIGTWYGKKFKAAQVKHIRMAHERGLGNMDISSLRIKEVNAG